MVYGYRRVSTAGQGKNGNSLECQEQELKKYKCDEIITEVYTGTKTDRPQLKALLDILREDDTFMVTKLDRFARTVVEGVQVVQRLLDRGVKVHILNIGLIENTSIGKLVLTVMLAFAEFERNMIVERTQEGKALAKKNNPDFREGRPKIYGKKQIEHALHLLEMHSYKEIEQMTGISKSTLIRAKKKRIEATHIS